jgi:hypothetical protein
MITTGRFEYEPGEHETEKASNSYLMSLIALMAGLPLPIFNLFASTIFFLSNRKGTYFVRWHCTQAFYSQISLLPLNSCGFWWTVSILFGSETVSNKFISYILAIFILNVAEFIGTIYTAIETRKGVHVVWWLYGDLTNLTCRR